MAVSCLLFEFQILPNKANPGAHDLIHPSIHPPALPVNPEIPRLNIE